MEPGRNAEQGDSALVMGHAFAIGALAVFASSLAAQSPTPARPPAPTPTPTSPAAVSPGTLSIFAEDDGFQLPVGSWKPTDRNYTMGLGLQWSGGRMDRFPLNRPLDLASRAVAALQPHRRVAYTSGMVHLSAFTPRDLHAYRPAHQDR